MKAIRESLAQGRVKLWLALNAVDFITTLIARETGSFSEGNPAISLFWANAIAFVAYKVLLCLGVILLLYRIRRLRLFRWLNIGMTAIVCWNLANLAPWLLN